MPQTYKLHTAITLVNKLICHESRLFLYSKNRFVTIRTDVPWTIQEAAFHSLVLHPLVPHIPHVALEIEVHQEYEEENIFITRPWLMEFVGRICYKITLTASAPSFTFAAADPVAGLSTFIGSLRNIIYLSPIELDLRLHLHVNDQVDDLIDKGRREVFVFDPLKELPYIRAVTWSGLCDEPSANAKTQSICDVQPKRNFMREGIPERLASCQSGVIEAEKTRDTQCAQFLCITSCELLKQTFRREFHRTTRCTWEMTRLATK